MRHRRPFLLALCCTGLLSAACSPALPRAEPSLEIRGLGARDTRLDASYQATEASCRVEELRLRDAVADRDSTRKVAQVVMAVAAGGLAVSTAVYAALDPSPKGNVIVPLSAGAGAAAVPLAVLLAGDEGTRPVEERHQRIRDRRLDVRDAHRKLMDASRGRERADAALADVERRLSEQRLADARRQIEAASAMAGKAGAEVQAARADIAGVEKAPRDAVRRLDDAKTGLDAAGSAGRAALATLDAGREAVIDAQRSEVAYARQRELDAEDALREALLRLGEVCGKGAAR